LTDDFKRKKNQTARDLKIFHFHRVFFSHVEILRHYPTTYYLTNRQLHGSSAQEDSTDVKTLITIYLDYRFTKHKSFLQPPSPESPTPASHPRKRRLRTKLNVRMHTAQTRRKKLSNEKRGMRAVDMH